MWVQNPSFSRIINTEYSVDGSVSVLGTEGRVFESHYSDKQSLLLLMLSKKKKDLIIRKKYINLEKKQILKKFVDTNLLSENFFQKEKKNVFFFSINKINQFIFLSKSKITRRCNLTNRNRTIIRKYNISQYKLKKLINFGIISGLNSSIW